MKSRAPAAPKVDAIVDAWCLLDRARALIPADIEAIEATRALRTLIVDEYFAGGADLFDACAILGRQLATRGASPTLAASTGDGIATSLARACGELLVDPSAIDGAIAEGYAAARRDEAARETLEAWEYPRCVVAIGPGFVAVAAGYPGEDAASTAQWAGRVGAEVARRGARRAIVGGEGTARDALCEALTSCGVDVLPDVGEPVRSWFPWKRRRVL